MPLKRTGPPKRRKPLKALGPMKTESNKRRQERSAREVVRDVTRFRYGICQLRPLGDCMGELDTHEVVKASQLAGARLNPDLTINLCRIHNGWVEDHPTLARRYGVSIPSWAYKNWPDRSLREAARLRERLWTTHDIKGDDPFWDGVVDL